VSGETREAVVCVHGLWLSGFAMRYWRTQFARAGYAAHAFSYPSVRGSLAHNAAALARFVAQLPQPVVHLAGHSLGGITILAMLRDHGWALPGKRLGRVVLVGSPVQGSHAGRALMGQAPARRLIGRFGDAMVGRSLKEWLARPAPQVPSGVAIGVLAGDAPLGLGRLIAPDLKRPHDGTVSVEETRLAGAAEHLVLPVNHSAMLVSPAVARCLVHFVARGRFA
jgi:pimeloyl-ACP methyl ester carboxylesterase